MSELIRLGKLYELAKTICEGLSWVAPNGKMNAI